MLRARTVAYQPMHLTAGWNRQGPDPSHIKGLWIFSPENTLTHLLFGVTSLSASAIGELWQERTRDLTENYPQLGIMFLCLE